MSRTQLVVTALLLALASVVATRLLKAFVVAEVLATAACIAGAGLLWIRNGTATASALNWPQRLIVAGSLTGLAGLAVKLVFVLFGIGADGGTDLHVHDPSTTERVLAHIHHLFFNVGFLLMFAAAVGLLVGRLRAPI